MRRSGNRLLMLDEFCHYLVDLRPGKRIMFLLYEFGRDSNDIWDYGHVKKVFVWFRENAAIIPLHAASMGECILI